MSPFQRRVIKRRSQLAKKGNPLFRNALKTQYNQAFSIISDHSIAEIPDQLRLIRAEPIKKAFEVYYTSASSIAMMWRENLIKDSNTIYKPIFENALKDYAVNKAGQRIKDITETTRELIINSVRDSMEQAVTDGLGVESTKKLIMQGVKDQFGQIGHVRARLIAQTESTTMANEAAIMAAKSTNREFRKYWSTSGLANVRPSHEECQQYSLDQGGLEENEAFPNGLLFPGDPSTGDAAETVNCHCQLIPELV